MENERSTSPKPRTSRSTQRNDQQSSHKGLRFIGIELTIFSAAILVFVIAIILILFLSLSQ